MSETTLSDRAAAALLASAAGDALGWITEFLRSRDDLARRFNVDFVRAFLPWEKQVGGRFQGYTDAIRAGDYSDDTQLAVSTAVCLRPDGGFDVERFAKDEFPAWLEYARGAGGTVREAASRLGRRSTRWSENFFSRKTKDAVLDYRDAGANGAAMRAAPHALANPGRWNQAEAGVWRNTVVSHGHPRAIVGALLYAHALHWLLEAGPAPDSRALLTHLGQSVKGYRPPETAEFMRWEARWDQGRTESFRQVLQATLDEAVEQLRFLWRALESRQESEAVLDQMGCFARETKGSGLGTVLAGLYLFARAPEQIEANVLAGVNAIGADTDSIAAFVGGLSGAAFGLDALPSAWRSVQDADFLARLGRHLAQPDPGFDPRPGRRLGRPGPALTRQNLAPGQAVFHRLLGKGQVVDLHRQDLLTRGKTAVVARVEFAVGQSCVFAFRTEEPSLTLSLVID